LLEKNNEIKNIVIVGGGTAGWMTALFVKMKMPDFNVTVIESEDIGILGAGEGTVPGFITFLDMVKIPFSRLIKEADATVKNSIKFTNWNDDKKHYYHGFNDTDDISLSSFNTTEYVPRTSTLVLINTANDKEFSEINFSEKIGETGKVGFSIYDDYQGQFVVDPIHKYQLRSYFASHFNAAKLAKLFKKIAENERDITRIEGKVVNYKFKENGDISKLILDSTKELNVDFIFDCTGFSREIIGKQYNAKWVSYKEKLSVDRAIPFFLPINKKSIPAYTEATAMKYGWMWKIPTQERFGCGYVFDSNHITDDEAKNEVETFLGEKIVSPKIFSFDAGCYETTWINNCVAIGISSGFVEPLEATSIWVSYMSLQHLLHNVNNFLHKNEKIVEEFNKKVLKINSQILDFLYFHYMGEKNDTEFWHKFKDTKKAPEFIQNFLETWSYRVPEYSDFDNSIFLFNSWISVAKGLNKINNKIYKETYKSNNIEKFFKGEYERFSIYHQEILDKCVTHVDFLEDMKEGFTS
jgi:tryptophan halogenase